MGFKLTIAAPDGIIYEKNDVDFIILPGRLGELGILKNHTPLLSALKKGRIMTKEKNQTKEFDIERGFVEIIENKVTVLAGFKRT